jgi:hypothetical protein
VHWYQPFIFAKLDQIERLYSAGFATASFPLRAQFWKQFTPSRWFYSLQSIEKKDLLGLVLDTLHNCFIFVSLASC